MRRIGFTKSEVEHLIGLVENENLRSSKRDTAISNVIEQTARCRNQHVNAMRQGLNLRAVANAAEHDGDSHVEVAPIGTKAL